MWIDKRILALERTLPTFDMGASEDWNSAEIPKGEVKGALEEKLATGGEVLPGNNELALRYFDADAPEVLVLDNNGAPYAARLSFLNENGDPSESVMPHVQAGAYEACSGDNAFCAELAEQLNMTPQLDEYLSGDQGVQRHEVDAALNPIFKS